MDIVTSRQNSVFKAFIAAKKDKAAMLLEGRRLVEDALSRGMIPEMAAVTAEYIAANGPLPCRFTLFSEDLLSRITDTVTPQGVVAFFPIPWAKFTDILVCEKVLVLDSLQDPGNMGTIIRTAEAFGFQAVIITGETVSPFSPKAVRASMGSCLGVCIAKADLSDLKTLPHRIISLVTQGDTLLKPDLFQGKVALCLGREGTGLSREILDICHCRVSIPMKGPTESLNVAIAAGIVMACACGVYNQ